MNATLEQLFEQPHRFSFFQAVRLLIQASRSDAGTRGPSSKDLATELARTVQFGCHPGMSFPASEIQTLERLPTSQTETGSEPAATSMRVNFLGLYGPSGTLPIHYTEWLKPRRHNGNAAAAAFLDIFNHRIMSLFWQVWASHNLVVMQELSTRHGPARHVFDLIGMGTAGLLHPTRQTTANEALPLPGRPPENCLAYFSGLITQKPHGSAALAQILSSYCNVSVQAKPCLGTWQNTPAAHRIRLGAARSRLGQGLLLGRQFWDHQTTLRLCVGPLSFSQFNRLLPGNGQLENVVELARFFTGLTLDLRIQLLLHADAIRPIRIASDAKNPHRLGWNTWLSGRRSQKPAGECEFHFHATGGKSWH